MNDSKNHKQHKDLNNNNNYL